MIAAYVVWYAKRHGFERGHEFSVREFARAFGRGIWALGAPFIILGGIYGGVFSPTEAAAVACVYAVLVTWLVFRELGWRDVLDAASTTALFTGQVLIIVACFGASWLARKGVNEQRCNLLRAGEHSRGARQQGPMEQPLRSGDRAPGYDAPARRGARVLLRP